MSYTPPLNGGRINVTISGNTAGAGALASTGTVTLAGGNNITLSQAGNAITISGGAGGAAGTNTLGISNLGNSAGTSGVITGTGLQFALAGGNNVTLSQSINASSATITVSAANQTVQTQNLHNLTLAGNSTSAGAGYVQISSGTLTMAGGNNITLSQNGNALTISGANSAAQSNQTLGFYAVGNTTQNSSTTLDARSLSYNGLGAATIGYSNGSIQVSAPVQSVQTQSVIQAISGPGAAVISTGTVRLINGNGITWGINDQSITASHNGLTTARASNDAIGLNTAQSNVTWTVNSAGLSLDAGGYAGTGTSATNASLTLNSNGLAISVNAGGGGATGSYFDNMFQQNSVQALTYTSLSTGMFGRVIIQPLAPGNELFPFNITASTALMNFSANATATAASSSHSSTFYMGIYTRVNSTQLSLLNSVSRSWGMTANTGNSASYAGARWLSIHSSQWSSQPVFVANSRYFFAILFRTSNYSGSSGSSLANSIAGMHLGHSVQRSGFLGSAVSSNTSYNAWHPFMGVHSLTTHTGMPASIANSEINKASVYANFIPQVIFDAGLGEVD